MIKLLDSDIYIMGNCPGELGELVKLVQNWLIHQPYNYCVKQYEHPWPKHN